MFRRVADFQKAWEQEKATVVAGIRLGGLRAKGAVTSRSKP